MVRKYRKKEKKVRESKLRVLTSGSWNNIMGDLESGVLDHRTALMCALTELADYIANQEDYFQLSCNFGIYDSRFGELVSLLYNQGVEIRPFTELYKSMFGEISNQITREGFDPVFSEEEMTARYKLGEMDKYPKRYMNDQVIRVRNIIRLLRDVYIEKEGFVFGPDGEITDHRFKELSSNFYRDLSYLEKMGFDSQPFIDKYLDMFLWSSNQSRNNTINLFVDGQRSPDSMEMVG